MSFYSNNTTNKERISRYHTNSNIRNIPKGYFLTIRKHQVKDYVDVQDIMNIIDHLITKFPSFTMGINSFEIDKTYNQLHFHAIVAIRESFLYKTNSSYGGFRLYWRPLYNKTDLISYITKDLYNKFQQDKIIIDNYYLHPKAPNRFVDIKNHYWV